MIAFDSGMLLIASDERLLLYNETAARIWSGLEAGLETEEIVAVLGRLDGCDRDEVRRDVDALIAEWHSEKVLPGSVRARAAAAKSDLPTPSGAAERWTCRIRGRTIGFEVEDDASAWMIRLLLDPLEVAVGAPEAWISVRDVGDGRSAILLDGAERARVSGGIGLRDTVHAALFDLAWPDRPISALIHGGAVARGGKAICLPAFAGSGKTTLIAHLARCGFDYLADDMAPFDAGGRILPWPTPLSVKQGSWALLEPLPPGMRWGRRFEAAKGPARLLVPPDEAWGREPMPVSAFVFPRFDPEACAALSPAAPIEALSLLFEAGLWLGHPLTEQRVRTFLAWFGAIPAFTLAYASLDEAGALIEGLLEKMEVQEAVS